MTPVEAKQFAVGALEAGERLLWTGCPSPERSARKLIPVSVIGVLFLAFTVGIFTDNIFKVNGPHTPEVARLTNDIAPYLFAVGATLLGLGLLVSPFVAYRNANRRTYAVTDRRILILQGSGSRRPLVQAFDRRCINMVERTDGPYGTGDVAFNETAFRGSEPYALTETSSFIGIDDARSVEQLFRETFQASNRTGNDVPTN